MFRELGEKRGIAFALESFACTAAARGEARRALTLAGVAAALREAINLRSTPADRAVVDGCLEGARRALGDEQSKQALANGRTLALERAIAYALESAAETS